MGIGALVMDEDGGAFEVAKFDPPSGPGGLVTVWGYPVAPKQPPP